MIEPLKRPNPARNLPVNWRTRTWRPEIVVCAPTEHSPLDVLQFNDGFLFDHERPSADQIDSVPHEAPVNRLPALDPRIRRAPRKNCSRRPRPGSRRNKSL
jgi:hypothetical protein